jgi:hypothetical protein
MQENTQPPTVGKPANLERERAFLASVARLDRYEAAFVLVDEDHAVINWVTDFLGTDGKRDLIAHAVLTAMVSPQLRSHLALARTTA